MSEPASAVLLRVATFAARKHRSQRRRDIDKTPYINHPIEVAHLLADVAGVEDVELLAAALLHDTVEDTDTSIEEIEQHFGRAVRELVAEVTDDKSLPKQRRKELQVETAPHKSDRAKHLKMADKICNIRGIDTHSPASWSLERKIEYLDWSMAVVAGCRGACPRLEQMFDETVEKVRAALLADD